MRFKLFDSVLGRRFDSITGIELPEDVESRQIEINNRLIEEANEILEFANTRGWKRIRGYIELDIQKMHGSLLDCKDMQRLLETQEFIKARQSLLNWIDAKISEGENLLEEQKQAQG